MVAGALYIRGGSGGEGLGSIGSSRPAQLVCVTELEAVCDELAGDDAAVTIEEAGDTAEALRGSAPADADAWLTLAPWPGIVADARARAGAPALPPVPADPLARSPLVMVVPRERGAVLDEHCDRGLSWRCIGTSAGDDWADLGGRQTWGRFKPGFSDPATSATGLLVLGEAASDYLGGSDFSARDLDGDEFFPWLAQLAEGIEGHGSPTNTPLQQQVRLAATFDVVGTTEAEAAPLLQSPRAESLDLRHPKNVVVAEVVLAPLREGDGADALRSLVEGAGKTALAEAGWRVQGQPAAPGVPDQPALPEESNVPSAGALEALRLRWEEIAR